MTMYRVAYTLTVSSRNLRNFPKIMFVTLGDIGLANVLREVEPLIQEVEGINADEHETELVGVSKVDVAEAEAEMRQHPIELDDGKYVRLCSVEDCWEIVPAFVSQCSQH